MRKDNKFMIMALLVSASTAVLAENVVEVNQSTTNYQEVNTEATSSDSTRLYLPTAGGVVWSISDPIILEKKLDVVSETGVLGLDKDDITFKVHSNYTDKLDKYELRVYRQEDQDHIEPLAVASGQASELKSGAVVLNTSTLDLKVGEVLEYNLRVYDEKGTYDETSYRRLFVDSLTPKVKEQDSNIVENQNSISKSNILVFDSKVRILGSELGNAKSVKVDGQKATVTNGKFVIEKHLAGGDYTYDVEVELANGDIIQKTLQVEVPKSHTMAVGIADLVIGKNRISGDTSGFGGEYHYDESTYKDGRLAFYLKSRFSNDAMITAQLDTEEKDIKNLFTNITRRDRETEVEKIDNEDLYLTYGDGSTIYRDVDTKGRMYLKGEYHRNNILWGNYDTGFTGTKYSEYNRSLYGAALELGSDKVTKFGDVQAYLKAFGSTPDTLSSRNEFEGTGGSLYYLKNTDVVKGSEKIEIQLLDNLTGRVSNTKVLQEGVDYEIDYYQGRIILTKPLQSYMDTLGVTSLITGGISNNSKTKLVVDYEYVSDGFETNNINHGVRGKVWLGNNVGVGGTYIKEPGDSSNLDYTLVGGDITLKASEGTFLKAEYAETEGSVSGSKFTSIDGGLNFVKEATSGINSKGSAYELSGRLNLRDISNQRGYIQGWYDKTEDGYSIGSQSIGDNKEYGIKTELNFTSTDVLGYMTKEKSDTDENSKYGLRVSQKLGDKFKASVEGRYEDISLVGNGVTVAGELEYSITNATRIYVQAEDVVSGDEAYKDERVSVGRLGLDTRLTDKISLRTEIRREFDDNQRTEGEVRLDAALSQNHDIYLGYILSKDRSDKFGNDITFGQKYRLNDKLSIYQENKFINTKDLGQGLEQLYGLDYDVSKKFRMGLSYGSGKIDKDSEVKRDSVSLYGRYDEKGTTFSSKLEYRRDKESNYQVDQITTVNKLSVALGKETTLSSKLNYSRTKDKISDDNEARFMEAGIGLAYRPIWNDDLNLLSEVVYTYDLQPLSQSSNVDEKSLTGSIEGIYRLDKHWDIGAKYSYKKGSERTNRDTGDWYDSTKDLIAARLTYHLAKEWDVFGEYHILRTKETDQSKSGMIVAVHKEISDNLRVGVGYNFTDFDDDLTSRNYDSKGWFINIVGKF